MKSYDQYANSAVRTGTVIRIALAAVSAASVAYVVYTIVAPVFAAVAKALSI
jgi:hypothetical protein